MSLRRQSNSASSAPVRVQNVSTEQTVKATAGFLRRIVVANANAAVQTLTVKDGATTLVVLQIPATDTREIDFDIPFTTSLKVTPSHANVDALFIFD